MSNNDETELQATRLMLAEAIALLKGIHTSLLFREDVAEFAYNVGQASAALNEKLPKFLYFATQHDLEV